MREAHPIEQTVGVAYYVADADGVGGRLKARPEDFRVRELEAFDPAPLDGDPGDYPHLVLRVTLHGWDTNDFAHRLSDAMGISRERVAWAGTKDKRAVTTQLFSVRDVGPADLPDVDGAEIDPVGRAGRAIEFGDLAGNAFEVVVRNPARPENATAVARDLRAFAGGDPDDPDDPAGVPNYFGQQRFGSKRPITHEVGLHVVHGEWREAVLAYVADDFETEPERTRRARQVVADEVDSDDPDWEACLEELPGRLRFERAMVHRLAGNGAETAADWRHALEAVPSNLQRLFVHAAQSYAFNRMLSERLRRGLPFDRPVAGDVVAFADGDAPDGVEKPDTDRLQPATDDRIDVLTRHCERGRAFVTAPLVGTGTDLADGTQGEIECKVLASLDIEPGDFDLPGDFDSTGTRRAIMVRTHLAVERDPLTFSFSLPSGSYATVVLREFLKVSPQALD